MKLLCPLVANWLGIRQVGGITSTRPFSILYTMPNDWIPLHALLQARNHIVDTTVHVIISHLIVSSMFLY